MKTTATETTFSCGHTEIKGGNLADPTAIYADLSLYVNDLGLCTTCSDPEKYKYMLEWKDSPKSDGMSS